jgi:hypothetical protein
MVVLYPNFVRRSSESAVVYLVLAGKYNGPVPSPLQVVNQPVMSTPIGVPGPDSALFTCLRAHLTRVAFR